MENLVRIEREGGIVKLFIENQYKGYFTHLKERLKTLTKYCRKCATIKAIQFRTGEKAEVIREALALANLAKYMEQGKYM